MNKVEKWQKLKKYENRRKPKRFKLMVACFSHVTWTPEYLHQRFMYVPKYRLLSIIRYYSEDINKT